MIIHNNEPIDLRVVMLHERRYCVFDYTTRTIGNDDGTTSASSLVSSTHGLAIDGADYGDFIVTPRVQVDPLFQPLLHELDQATDQGGGSCWDSRRGMVKGHLLRLQPPCSPSDDRLQIPYLRQYLRRKLSSEVGVYPQLGPQQQLANPRFRERHKAPWQDPFGQSREGGRSE